MIDELLVNFLATDSDIAAASDEIAVGQVPKDVDGKLQVDKYIWISMFDEFDHMDLEGKTGLTEYSFDIECCATSTKPAKTLGRLVKKKLQGHIGAFGEVTNDDGTFPGEVQLIDVESKDDDYQPRNRFTIDDFTVISMGVTIWADDAQDDIQGN